MNTSESPTAGSTDAGDFCETGQAHTAPGNNVHITQVLRIGATALGTANPDFTTTDPAGST